MLRWARDFYTVWGCFWVLWEVLIYEGNIRGSAGWKMNQYCSPTRPVLVALCDQYYFEVGPVLVGSLTSTGSFLADGDGGDEDVDFADATLLQEIGECKERGARRHQIIDEEDTLAP